ncbi:hypothetical protein SAMN05660653_03130 [Desulfonatronum thiosulfatophilum]|uniref:Lipopolysaccharide assembly protein A domain-containing protein n=1 Tax=Desulfonatronum thiosulfatophilum TaxID=617002 RepID=A0A1G6ETC7_9BACT|nr:hypothetical protein [Desulfonatronum thiosulfatophilum]SDB60700.1 hypothetical protein SAMN05660653_03130 [Desulfonatronum thiosulfatophilum]
MKLIKVLFLTLLFVLTMLFAVQNADILAIRIPFAFTWEPYFAYGFELPFLGLLAFLFVTGFLLTSFKYFGEYFALSRALEDTEKNVMALERELAPEPKSEPASEPKTEPLPETGSDLPEPETEKTEIKIKPAFPPEQKQDSVRGDEPAVGHEPTSTTSDQKTAAERIAMPPAASHTLHIPSEPTMQTSTPESTVEKKTVTSKDAAPMDDEILVRPAGPGWGATVLLAAAMALVISSGVYIVLNEQISSFSEHLGELHVQSGHMNSVQEEMARTMEQERIAFQEEMAAMGRQQALILDNLGYLDQQMQVLQNLPDVLRNRLMAGFLRDAAAKTAYLETQVETQEQRETLERVQQMLHDLAEDLDGDESAQ